MRTPPFYSVLNSDSGVVWLARARCSLCVNQKVKKSPTAVRSLFDPFVQRMRQCTPAVETALQHEHMCGAWSDGVCSLAHAVAVLLAAGMREDGSACQALASR